MVNTDLLRSYTFPARCSAENGVADGPNTASPPLQDAARPLVSDLLPSRGCELGLGGGTLQSGGGLSSSAGKFDLAVSAGVLAF